MRPLYERLVHRDIRLRNVLVHHVDARLAQERKQLRVCHRGFRRLLLCRRVRRTDRNFPAFEEFLEFRDSGIPIHIARKRKHDPVRRIHSLGQAFHVGNGNLLVLLRIGIPQPRIRGIVHLGTERRKHLRRSIVTAVISSQEIRPQNLKLFLVKGGGREHLFRQGKHIVKILRKAVYVKSRCEGPDRRTQARTDKFQRIVKGSGRNTATTATTQHTTHHGTCRLILQDHRHMRLLKVNCKIHQRKATVTYDVARNPGSNFDTEILRIGSHIAKFRKHDILVACGHRRGFSLRHRVRHDLFCNRGRHRIRRGSGSNGFRLRLRRTRTRHKPYSKKAAKGNMQKS